MRALSAPVETAYRSDRAEVLVVYRAYQQDRKRQIEAADAQLKAWGFPEHHSWLIQGGGAMGTRDTIIGVQALDGPPPDGWREPRDYPGAWVPKLTSRAGKKIREELEAIQPPTDLRERLPGMPRFTMNGNRVLSPALFCLDDAIYMYWAAKPQDPVDPELWTEIKMSDWYLAKERLNGQ